MKKESIQVASWIDMAEFGVQYLTAESCVFSMRLLCDVNEDGRALVADYLGLARADEGMAPPWNSQVNGKPSVASILLHRDSLKQIAMFAMFRMGALAVLSKHGTLVGVFEPELLARYEALMKEHPDMGYDLYRNYRRPGQQTVGTRNVHAFTGRVD